MKLKDFIKEMNDRPDAQRSSRHSRKPSTGQGVRMNRFTQTRSVEDISKLGKPALGLIWVWFRDNVTLEEQRYAPPCQDPKNSDHWHQIAARMARFEQRCYAVEYWDSLTHETRHQYRREFNQLPDGQFESVADYAYAQHIAGVKQ